MILVYNIFLLIGTLWTVSYQNLVAIAEFSTVEWTYVVLHFLDELLWYIRIIRHVCNYISALWIVSLYSELWLSRDWLYEVSIKYVFCIASWIWLSTAETCRHKNFIFLYILFMWKFLVFNAKKQNNNKNFIFLFIFIYVFSLFFCIFTLRFRTECECLNIFLADFMHSYREASGSDSNTRTSICAVKVAANTRLTHFWTPWDVVIGILSTSNPFYVFSLRPFLRRFEHFVRVQEMILSYARSESLKFRFDLSLDV